MLQYPIKIWILILALPAKNHYSACKSVQYMLVHLLKWYHSAFHFFHIWITSLVIRLACFGSFKHINNGFYSYMCITPLPRPFVLSWSYSVHLILVDGFLDTNKQSTRGSFGNSRAHMNRTTSSEVELSTLWNPNSLQDSNPDQGILGNSHHCFPFGSSVSFYFYEQDSSLIF